jgi:signal transduction histidine kinase
MALARISAYAAAAVVAAIAVLGVVFAVEVGRTGESVALAVAIVLSGAVTALGVLVATRQPRNVVGLLLVLVGLIPVGTVAGDLREQAYAPASPVELALSAGGWMVFYLLPALLLLYFPDGRAAGPRWRWVGPTMLLVVVIFGAAAALDPAPFPPPYQQVPHPFHVPEKVSLVMGGVGAGMLPIFLGLLIAAVASIVVRYRSAGDGVQRAQLKWLALGAAFLPATLLLAWAEFLLFGDGRVILIGFALTYLAIPAAIAIAILRPDLFDVDRAVSAAIIYGLVVTVLLACYTIAFFLIGVGTGRASPVAAAAVTAVCAALLAPLRSRLRRRVDRRLDPTRQAALTAIEQLQARTHAGEDRPEHLERVLREAMRDPLLRVGYRVPGLTGLVAADGTPIDARETDVVRVELAGRETGAIIRGTMGTPALLREVAAASAVLVEVVRLRIQVNQALDAADSSRSRLLHASYQERRRLERDLHDGAQQRLVSLGKALRSAQRHLRDDSVDVDGLLDDAVADVGAAVMELRRLANGLRPSSLDDGLDHALAVLASEAPVPVTLDVEVTGLPDDVAITAYYVANEAMANAVKHADPAAIGVQVRQAGGLVTVQVKDDGRGGATMRPGAGLAGLADRVAAAGGALRLTSAHGLGTTVEAVLPCES